MTPPRPRPSDQIGSVTISTPPNPAHTPPIVCPSQKPLTPPKHKVPAQRRWAGHPYTSVNHAVLAPPKNLPLKGEATHRRGRSFIPKIESAA